MFDKSLIESGNQPKDRGSVTTTVVSFALHALALAAVIGAGYWVKENPEVIEKPIEAFVVQAAPPPPPPPPPPPASSSTPQQTTPIETPRQPRDTFTAPDEIPQETPDAPSSPNNAADEDAGVVGGVVGGVEGGVVGGVVGGVIGGTLGGELGGQLGGQGDMPVRVGGDVKPPTIITRVDPAYTEVARKARVQGVVVLEAIIDRNGNVTDVRVLKGLPMGLGDSAMDAVRRWKFKPGNLGGKPVPVIFNLTVNFRLQ